jgi:anti-sigma regulatory factor (Ser/Thr protein kinase)/GAF domain-containing protein
MRRIDSFLTLSMVARWAIPRAEWPRTLGVGDENAELHFPVLHEGDLSVSHRLRVVLILIGAAGMQGIVIGLFARTDPSSFRGVPGTLCALIAVAAATMAGPIVGVVTALVGGVLFVTAITHGLPGSELAALLWAVAAAVAGVIAQRYRRLMQDRDAAYEGERLARQESERARGRLARLQVVTVALSGALSTDDAVEAVARHAVEAVGASGAAIGLIDESGRVLETTVALAHQADRATKHMLPIDAEVALCESFRTGEAVDVAAPMWRTRFPQGHALLGHLGPRLASRPLIVGTERVGAIGLAFREQRELDAADLELLDAVVRQVALAVPRVRTFESEQQIAATLQNSLLPPKLPKIAGIELSARYVAGADGIDVGGDWYDAVTLPSGAVCLAVGDVSGRGLMAAASMGQLRSAWHALAAIEEMSPAAVLDALDRYVDEMPDAAFSTVVSVRLDPGTGCVDFSCAGHPPPLVIAPGGEANYLPGGRSMPLGVPWPGIREDQRAELPAGSTLMLYTDGLIERRGEPIDRGFQRLRDTASARSTIDRLDDLGEILSRLVPAGHGDDVAMLFVRAETTPSRFLRCFASNPRELAGLRHEIRRWLRSHGADSRWCDDVVLACGEAASNAIEHGYLGSAGEVEVSIEVASDGSILACVMDHGTWRPEGSDPFRGRGLVLMSSLMDGVDINTGSEGTTVSMRKSLAEHAALA